MSPKFGFFGAVEGNHRDLRGKPSNPSSDGYRALAGVTIQLSRLIMGEFGLGTRASGSNFRKL